MGKDKVIQDAAADQACRAEKGNSY